MSLIEDLNKAEQENTVMRPCQMCAAIEGVSDDVTRVALTRAAAGTIGRDKLVRILRQNGLPASRRAIERHRTEGHLS
jgi:hypothetical protein